MENRVLEIMSEVLNLSEENLKKNMDNKEIWDSITRVEILFTLEDEYGIAFSEEEMAQLITPGTVCEAVVRKVQ